MFRSVRMKKINILALEDFKNEVIKRIHELGSVHITDYRETLEDEEWARLLKPHPPDKGVRRITSLVQSIDRSLDIFEGVDTTPKESFFKTAFNPSPPRKIPTDDISHAVLLQSSEDTIELVEGETREPMRSLEEIDAQLDLTSKSIQSVERIKGLNIDLSLISEGEFVSSIIGEIPKENQDKVISEVEEATGGRFFGGSSEAVDDKVAIIILFLRENADDILKILRRSGFERIDLRDMEGMPETALTKLRAKLEELENERLAKEKLIIEISREYKDKLIVLRELLNIERERADIQSRFASSDTVFTIEGWVPAEKADYIKKEVEDISRGHAVIDLKDGSKADDNTPILLKNPPFFRHFELITRLYGIPRYNNVDPTVFVAPGFLLFFSIMLTDALYGLMAAILGFLVVRGGGRYNSGYKDFGIIMASAGIFTVLIGGLTGGWFGDIGVALIPSLKSIIILDPMKKVDHFLILALSIGLLHVNIGVVINIWDKIDRGLPREVFKGNLWFLVLQPAVLLIFLGKKGPALVLIFISLILLAYKAKGMSMFSITGFMGDILSYARLMALGLCTTGIAMTVNMLVGMVKDSGIVGLVFAPIIFIFGHVFNFVINAMGAFVHGLRLHYVEFFTKFFESGGEAFMPFEVKREVTALKLKIEH